MLEREFQYYLDHQDELVKKYDGKVIVIIDEKVVGVYPTFAKAYFESIKKYDVGTFLIQECTRGKESYTQTFHSRILIA